MAGKDFSIVTRILMDTAGFTSGKEKITSEGKAMERAITNSAGAMKDSFGQLTNTALPALAGQFGQLGSVIGSLKGVFGGLVTASKTASAALVSTGIGAIIIGISLAIAGLISWMKRTETGGDAMRHVFDVIKAIINVVLEKISLLGSAIYKITQGDFKGAWQDIKNAFTGWGAAMKENIATANKLNEVQDKLETFNVTYALKRAEIERTISELQLKARKKQEDTGKIDLKFNEQLKAAKLDLYNLELQQKQLEVDVAQYEYDMGAKNDDTLQKLNDKKAELIGLQTTYNESLKENVKLDNKGVADKEKEVAALQKMKDLNDKIVDKMKESATIKMPSSLYDAVNAKYKPVIGKGFLAGGNTLAGAPDTIEHINATVTALNEEKTALQLIGETAQTTASAFSELGNAITAASADGKISFSDATNIIMQAAMSTISILSALAAAHIITAESSKGVVGIFTAIAGLAMLAGIWSAFVKPKKYAAGGTLPNNSGYSLAGENGIELIENAGQRIYSNSQTRNILGGNGGGVLTTKVSGTDLLIVLNNTQKHINSFA